MPLRNTNHRYGAIAQAFHWLMLVLVAAQAALGWNAAHLPVGLERLKRMTLHKEFGIALLLLVALRLGWRLFDRPPPLPAGVDAATRRYAAPVHAALYALLFAVPLSGWLASSAAGRQVNWFGLLVLPNLITPDPALIDPMTALHHLLDLTLVLLVGGHAAAALWHGSRGDGVLERMLPR